MKYFKMNAFIVIKTTKKNWNIFFSFAIRSDGDNYREAPLANTETISWFAYFISKRCNHSFFLCFVQFFLSVRFSFFIRTFIAIKHSNLIWLRNVCSVKGKVKKYGSKRNERNRNEEFLSQMLYSVSHSI